MRNSSQQIVFFDGLIRQIVETYPDRAVELLMREYTYCNDRESFVAALVGQLVMRYLRTRRAQHPVEMEGAAK